MTQTSESSETSLGLHSPLLLWPHKAADGGFDRGFVWTVNSQRIDELIDCCQKDISSLTPDWGNLIQKWTSLILPFCEVNYINQAMKTYLYSTFYRGLIYLNPLNYMLFWICTDFIQFSAVQSALQVTDIQYLWLIISRNINSNKNIEKI